MATSRPRIQVTVDPELSQALAEIDPAPKSQSRLLRDLAIRGAKAVNDDRRALAFATQELLDIAADPSGYDFEAGAALVAAREDRLP